MNAIMKGAAHGPTEHALLPLGMIALKRISTGKKPCVKSTVNVHLRVVFA
jgi:hypothetical protein